MTFFNFAEIFLRHKKHHFKPKPQGIKKIKSVQLKYTTIPTKHVTLKILNVHSQLIRRATRKLLTPIKQTTDNRPSAK